MIAKESGFVQACPIVAFSWIMMVRSLRKVYTIFPGRYCCSSSFSGDERLRSFPFPTRRPVSLPTLRHKPSILF